MESKAIIINLLENLTSQIDTLKESDLLKIKAETHEITIQLKKKKSRFDSKRLLSEEKKKIILNKLQTFNTRDDGTDFLEHELLTKKEFEQIAKSLDILVLKKDKVEEIKDKIIESTIGAVLRSNAIQGSRRNK